MTWPDSVPARREVEERKWMDIIRPGSTKQRSVNGLPFQREGWMDGWRERPVLSASRAPLPRDVSGAEEVKPMAA